MIGLLLLLIVAVCGFFVMRKTGPTVGGPFLVWSCLGLALLIGVIAVRALSR